MSIWQIVLSALAADFGLCVVVGKAIAHGQAKPEPLTIHIPDTPAALLRYTH